MRADIFLVEKGFVESRTKASRLISENKVSIDGRTVNKPSEDISDGEHTVDILERDRYVSRGGLKLEAALERFFIEIRDKKCIDIGASTGGFTDCLLQKGAAWVFAVDSGRGQLHSRILADERVISVEGYNARQLSADEFGSFDIAVMDVSFISQTLLHLPVSKILRDGGIFVSLIKPQFEAGKQALGKHGIVKKEQDRIAAVIKVIDSAALCGLEVMGVIASPIEGGDGNREYLAYFVNKGDPDSVLIDSVDKIKKTVKNIK